MDQTNYYTLYFGLAKAITTEIRSILPENTNQSKKQILLIDHIKDKDLIKVSSLLFEQGHHARSVEEAFKLLNNIVKKYSNQSSSTDGSNLMKKVFSANAPILKINAGENQSERDEQLGYMEIFSGVMTGIRNPRAHEHDWEDTQERAFQLLILADHLIAKVKQSIKTEEA